MMEEERKEGADMEIVADGNLFGFFYDKVQAASAEQGSDLEEHTEFYLVNLLVDFLRTRKLVRSGGQRVDQRPFGVRLLEAMIGDPRARTSELKHLADSTLYLLGFFGESLERRSSVDRGYYAGLGTSAYRHLAVLTGGGFSNDSVFSSLGDRFEECVGVLEGVRSDGAPNSDSEILALYERWLATGDERVARRLEAKGMLIAPPKSEGGGSVH